MTPQETAAYEAGRRAKKNGQDIDKGPHAYNYAWQNGWRAMAWQMEKEEQLAHCIAAQDRNDAELRRANG